MRFQTSRSRTSNDRQPRDVVDNTADDGAGRPSPHLSQRRQNGHPQHGCEVIEPTRINDEGQTHPRPRTLQTCNSPSVPDEMVEPTATIRRAACLRKPSF